MKWRWSLVTLLLLGSQAPAQESAPVTAAPVLFPNESTGTHPVLLNADGPLDNAGGLLTGNHDFRNFINFVSNPLQNIDPRAVTAVYPLFGSVWVSNTAPIPNADGQVYGPALTVALSDRLAVGMNQGGYADIHLSRNQRDRLIRLDRAGRFRDVEFGGNRSGWLDIGGFVQYTVIADVEDQFLVTAGVRWAAPCGSHEVFQGHGPLELSPYLTAGKEFGEFHVLTTGGYQFPAGPGSDNTKLFYSNLHLDRRLFGWLYPLVELNWSYHEKSVSFGLPTRRGFIDFGNFDSEGNVLSLAVGANAVLVPEKVEIGAVYTTVLAAQHDFEANGLLVKMTLRY